MALRCNRSRNESGDADEQAIFDELPMLYALLSAFERKDVFKADKLFYQQAPTTTMSPRSLLGKKKNMDRIAFLACTSADGSERVAL